MTIHNLSVGELGLRRPGGGKHAGDSRRSGPNYGFDPNNTSEFSNKFRNVVLPQYPAESIYISYTEKGKDGMKEMINKLVRKRLLKK